MSDSEWGGIREAFVRDIFPRSAFALSDLMLFDFSTTMLRIGNCETYDSSYFI